jgi:hypothetical protein
MATQWEPAPVAVALRREALARLTAPLHRHRGRRSARGIDSQGRMLEQRIVNLTSYWNERKAPETGVVPISSGYTLEFWRGREERCQTQFL